MLTVPHPVHQLSLHYFSAPSAAAAPRLLSACQTPTRSALVSLQCSTRSSPELLLSPSSVPVRVWTPCWLSTVAGAGAPLHGLTEGDGDNGTHGCARHSRRPLLQLAAASRYVCRRCVFSFSARRFCSVTAEGRGLGEAQMGRLAP
ncbi:hypothetical protein M011DRAFT_128630 [Sporormia fimetaria CBS 119925]|uniref:Uncharacterized protein n=1 Tax=Sporormia fimetaria CBS 119925 TaxID=1340428 RepID=A0A6A6V7T1_9PLEO|nr:hypothetical protein M011DRAFT_128630 [Sporormia fimetaria CBS 119925]